MLREQATSFVAKQFEYRSGIPDATLSQFGFEGRLITAWLIARIYDGEKMLGVVAQRERMDLTFFRFFNRKRLFIGSV